MLISTSSVVPASTVPITISSGGNIAIAANGHGPMYSYTSASSGYSSTPASQKVTMSSDSVSAIFSQIISKIGIEYHNCITVYKDSIAFSNINDVIHDSMSISISGSTIAISISGNTLISRDLNESNAIPDVFWMFDVLTNRIFDLKSIA